jgi:hypothetical protein
MNKVDKVNKVRLSKLLDIQYDFILILIKNF